MDETHCYYAGSFALLKIATHRPLIPIPDFDGIDSNWFLNMYPNSILYVCAPALPGFVKKILPTISVPFKLITNNSDYTIPNDFQAESDILLKNPYLVHWFVQNCTLTHDKITRIPIGMDYHSLHIEPPKLKFISAAMNSGILHRNGWGICKPAKRQEQDLIQIKHKAKPFWERQLKAYANFHFAMGMGHGKQDRPDAYKSLPKDLIYYEPTKAHRNTCWEKMIQHAFVVSPHGNGLDCHRTWEALALGCIPIVKTSGLDPLFDDLPVWIVQTWSDVTQDTMKQKIEEFRNKTFKYEKLTLAYWRNIFVSTTL